MVLGGGQKVIYECRIRDKSSEKELSRDPVRERCRAPSHREPSKAAMQQLTAFQKRRGYTSRLSSKQIALRAQSPGAVLSRTGLERRRREASLPDKQLTVD